MNKSDKAYMDNECVQMPVSEDKSASLMLRQVNKEDAKLLFEWTNDPETRKNSFSSQPVLWENHVEWLSKKLADENCLFFILTDGTLDMGTIRLDIDREAKIGTISYSIDVNHRGKGLGGRMLALIEKEAKRAGVQCLLGGVKPENGASARCFVKNGYEVAEENVQEVLYRKAVIDKQLY